jgi:ribosomal-protein-alanine N-acetyltransferase
LSAWSIAAFDERHIDGIVAIENTCFKQPWQRISFFSEIYSRDSLGKVVLYPSQETIIAYAILRLNFNDLHLLRVAVAPSWRRKGIAVWLLKECFKTAIHMGANIVYLELRQSNISAKNLYLKLGFQIIARRPKYYMDTGENALVMMKFLEGNNEY